VDTDLKRSSLPAAEASRPSNVGNRLLDSIPANESAAVGKISEKVELERGELVAASQSQFRHLYFPIDSVFSYITDLHRGDAVESGTVGNEGFVGIPVLLGADRWIQRTIAQIPGGALKVPSSGFMELLPSLPALRALLDRYLLAYISQVSQTSACNSQHTILQRCARWILLTEDRVGRGTIPLTQEFLSYMLGVRRPSVTVTQADLQKKGLLTYTRGQIEILDRPGMEKVACECYSVVRDEFDSLIGARVG
jgi:CRP-like cAMP-binding protein